MLNEQDIAFMRFWEEVRTHQKKWRYKLIPNLSIGIIFGIFMIIFFLVDGERDRTLVSHTDLVFIMIGAIAIAIFYAVLRSNMLWEKNESRYTILKLREKEDKNNQERSSSSELNDPH